MCCWNVDIISHLSRNRYTHFRFWRPYCHIRLTCIVAFIRWNFDAVCHSYFPSFVSIAFGDRSLELAAVKNFAFATDITIILLLKPMTHANNMRKMFPKFQNIIYVRLTSYLPTSVTPIGDLIFAFCASTCFMNVWHGLKTGRIASRVQTSWVLAAWTAAVPPGPTPRQAGGH